MNKICSYIVATISILSMHQVALAADTVTIEVAHNNPFDSVISTTIIQPNNKQIVDKTMSYKHTELPPGLYAIQVTQPNGAQTTMDVLIDGVSVKKGTSNVAFSIENGQTAFISVVHEYNRTGNIGVSTKPNGVPFVLTGPNELEWKGITPTGYENLPEGQYSIIFTPPEGCGGNRPLSNKLVKNGRVNFTSEFQCDAAYILEQEHNESTVTYVQVLQDNISVSLYDVPAKEWYAQYVQLAIKGNIMSGYTNADGTRTNTFGPTDTVNLAQLSKIAHKLAGIDETKSRSVLKNKRAENQWFSEFYRSAERQHWLVYMNHNDEPDRNATRAEVVQTIMQSLNRPRIWPTGDVFTDINPLTKYADTIEAAANDGLIDSGGNFRPNDPINRAEISKLIAKAIDIYIDTK